MTIPIELLATIAGVFATAACGLTAWISVTLLTLVQTVKDLPCCPGIKRPENCPDKHAGKKFMLRSLSWLSFLTCFALVVKLLL
jgi:hypothetical protein